MVRIDQAVRLAPGTRLTFRSMACGALFEQASRLHPSLDYWWQQLRHAALHVDSVDDNACRLTLRSGDADGCVEIASDADGSFVARAELRVVGDEPRQWQRTHLVLMLGGKRDVYLAQRTPDGDRLLLKLKYDAEGLQMSLMRDAFAHRLSEALRSLLPGEIKVGTLAAAGRDVAVA